MSILNQYSFIWLVLILIIIAVRRLLRKNPKWKEFLVLGIFVVALLGAWTILRPSPSIPGAEASEVQAGIGQGKPVLLEFLSPY